MYFFYILCTLRFYTGDYNVASSWLVSLGYPPLQLSKSFWEGQKSKIPNWFRVVLNYESGFHSYNEVVTLIKYSCPNVLIPVCEFRYADYSMLT